ncbi:hypothetical protein ACFPTY_15760 [Halomonas beimenensis]|uniref:hypothetical protein n=1 Tax=Halomonas beimenensis TaxID=475662 RepID=UPI00360FD88F
MASSTLWKWDDGVWARSQGNGVAQAPRVGERRALARAGRLGADSTPSPRAFLARERARI